MAAMAESTELNGTEPESDEEIQRILDERHSKNTTKATKNALKTFSETVGDVQSLTSKEMLDKSLAKFFGIIYHIFRYNISFIDPPLGGFGKILPSAMIFPSGQAPREISSLRVIFCRIPLAPGL